MIKFLKNMMPPLRIVVEGILISWWAHIIVLYMQDIDKSYVPAWPVIWSALFATIVSFVFNAKKIYGFGAACHSRFYPGSNNVLRVTRNGDWIVETQTVNTRMIDHPIGPFVRPNVWDFPYIPRRSNVIPSVNWKKEGF